MITFAKNHQNIANKVICILTQMLPRHEITIDEAYFLCLRDNNHS